MSNEIAELPAQESALTVFSQPQGLDPWIEKVRAEVTGQVPDLKTKKGRDAIASLAYKVTKVKTALENIGKGVSAELKAAPKKVDAERSRMREILEALAAEVRQPLTEWEEAEATRVASHKEAISWFSLRAQENSDLDSIEIRASIEEVSATTVDNFYEEFEADAHRAKDHALKSLAAALEKREKYEAEQAELARLRAEAAEREQADRDAKIAKEAAERAQLAEQERVAEAERKAKQVVADAEAAAEAERLKAEKREADLKLAAEQAENRRLQQERQAEEDRKEAAAKAERDKQQAIEDERARKLAEEEKERRATEARERDRSHRGKVNRAALAALVEGGISEEIGQQVIKLIAAGKVPSVVVNY